MPYLFLPAQQRGVWKAFLACAERALVVFLSYSDVERSNSNYVHFSSEFHYVINIGGCLVLDNVYYNVGISLWKLNGVATKF